MRILAKRFKTKLSAIDGLAGLGDLVLTAYSPHSDNRLQGEKIAKKQKISQSEGLRTLNFLAQKIKNKEKLPILAALEQIVLNKKDASKIIPDLFPQ